MFHRAAAVLVGLVALALAPVSANAADRLIVGFSASTSVAQQVRELQAAGVDGITSAEVRATDIPALDAATVEVASGDLADVRAELLDRPEIEFVELDRIATAAWVPDDPRMSQQWGHAMIGMGPAWDAARGTGIKIAVVDTGVSYTHPDLLGKVELGHDYVAGDEDPMDEQGHGTHVAGVAAGIADNGTGIAGVAPNARILAVRVLDKDGSGYYSWIASGIIYAADHGAKVINLSLGGSEGSAALEQAVNYATAKGAIVVCASGNEGATAVGYPARYDACISVGATDQGDVRADFSNHGPGLDVVAPGKDILSSVRGGGYESWSGTSMATPSVSGVAAMLVSKGLTATQVRSTIVGSVHDLGAPGYDTEYGNGRLDAAAALTAAAAIQPAATDVVAPVVASITVGAAVAAAGDSAKETWRWKRVKITRWRVVGRSASRGRYSWVKRRRVATNMRRFDQFQMRRGVVRQRTVVERRVQVPTGPGAAARALVVAAVDDVAVDRVGVKVDGAYVGTDWSGADGWSIAWTCSPGVHTLTAMAFDAADNQHVLEVKQVIVC